MTSDERTRRLREGERALLWPVLVAVGSALMVAPLTNPAEVLGRPMYLVRVWLYTPDPAAALKAVSDAPEGLVAALGWLPLLVALTATAFLAMMASAQLLVSRAFCAVADRLDERLGLSRRLQTVAVEPVARAYRSSSMLDTLAGWQHYPTISRAGKRVLEVAEHRDPERPFRRMFCAAALAYLAVALPTLTVVALGLASPGASWISPALSMLSELNRSTTVLVAVASFFALAVPVDIDRVSLQTVNWKGAGTMLLLVFCGFLISVVIGTLA